MKNLALILFSLALVACESSEEKDLKQFVSSQFKDPQSTQFQKVTFKNGVICGEVNSKNGYGAYVGFKRFFAEKKAGDFSGNVEDVGIIGKGFSLLEMSAEGYLLTTKINLLLVANGKSPKDYFKEEHAEKVFLKYTSHRKQIESKVTVKTDEQALKTLAVELARPIEFQETFSSSCPSS